MNLAKGEGKMPHSFDNDGQLGWDDVLELLEELRDMAKRLLARWPNMHSLQPTLLVTTALRRQCRSDQAWEEVTWDSRQEFFGLVHRAMRHKLVEYRRHQRTARYGAVRMMSVAELELYNNWRKWTEDPEVAAALGCALERLSNRKDLSDLIQYRFFEGLTWPEIAKMLDVSLSSVTRGWAKARVILEDAMRTVRVDTQPV
jgi:DNA-directed RNA polymerase specialized sigma24 family protein